MKSLPLCLTLLAAFALSGLAACRKDSHELSRGSPTQGEKGGKKGGGKKTKKDGTKKEKKPKDITSPPAPAAPNP